MSEHDVDARLRSWARSGSDGPAPAELREQVRVIPTTEAATEHRRWLWFLPTGKPTAGASGGGERTQPNQPTIQPRGGIRTMFSATKSIGIAATVGLIGAVMLADPLNLVEPDPVADPGFDPSAPTQPMESWVAVVGTEICAQVDQGTRTDLAGGDFRERGEVYSCTAETNDERASMPFTVTSNADCFSHLVKVGAVEDICLYWGTTVMGDEAAGWDCTYTGSNDPYAPFNALLQGTCTGTGANEGSTYVYEWTAGEHSRFRDESTIRGIIYEGGPPPFEE